MSKIIETFMTSTMNVIQQRIFHFDKINEVKLARFQNSMKKLKKFVEKFASANNAKNVKVKII